MHIRVILCVACLMLTSCASVPLHTAWRLSSLSREDLVHIDPAQVRVKVSVPRGFAIDIPATRLKLVVTASGQERIANMRLNALERHRGVRSRGWLHHDVPVCTVMLELTADSRRQLRAMQRFIDESGPLHYQFSLIWPLAEVPPDAGKVTIWADLQLRADRRYLPLVDAAHLALPKKGSE